MSVSSLVSRSDVAARALPCRSLAFSALRAGSLAGVVLRPSSRSGSGFVLVARFRSAASAGAFARRAAARLGYFVVVRGPAVSVPCAPPRSAPVLAAGRLALSPGLLRRLPA